MKKIIFLFLIFSAMLFAKWEVETGYTTDGEPLTSFKTYDTTTITNYLSETDTNLLSEINDLSESDKNLLKEGIKLFYPYLLHHLLIYFSTILQAFSLKISFEKYF